MHVDWQFFFLPAGLVLGLVYAPTLLAAAAWTVQVTLSQGIRTGLAVAAALATAQALLMGTAALLIFAAWPYLMQIGGLVRFTSASFLLWLAWQVYRSPPLRQLIYAAPRFDMVKLVKRTFRKALFMPWRLTAWLAFLLSLNLHYREIAPANALLLAVGGVIAGMAWWGFFAVLTALFGKRVPPEISLRSLNKLRMLGVAVFLGLCLICLGPFFF